MKKSGLNTGFIGNREDSQVENDYYEDDNSQRQTSENDSIRNPEIMINGSIISSASIRGQNNQASAQKMHRLFNDNIQSSNSIIQPVDRHQNEPNAVREQRSESRRRRQMQRQNSNSVSNAIQSSSIPIDNMYNFKRTSKPGSQENVNTR